MRPGVGTCAAAAPDRPGGPPRIGHNEPPRDPDGTPAGLEAPALTRARALVAAGARLPSALRDDMSLHRATRFARQLDNAGVELRRARLTATRPLRIALKAASAVFSPLEAELRTLRARTGDMLDAALAEGRLEVSEPPGPTSAPATQSRDPLLEEVTPAALPAGRGHTAPGTAAQVQASPSPATAARSGGRPAVAAGWAVAEIDRAAVDLEALRPYLTDHALRQAIERQLRAEGPHRLAGVRHRLRSLP